MKKLFILLLLLVSAPLFAQVSYGIKGGITSSTEDWQFVPKFASSGTVQNHDGLNIGIFGEYSGDKYIAVIAELNYRQKGANIFFDYTGRDTSGTIVVPKNIQHRVSYLNISLLGKAKYTIGFFTPYLLAGLKTDYQLSNKFDDVDLGFIATESTSQIWGAVLGGGFEVKDILPVVLLAEVRYEFDFNKQYTDDYFQFKMNTLEFRLGIKF